VLLAWNVYLQGITLPDAREIARRIRERDGGFPGLRALALELPQTGRVQISMNLERLHATSALDVLRRIEALAADHGAEVVETEVIGMLPDELLLHAAADRLRLRDATLDRVLSGRLLRHLEGSGAFTGPGNE
jgi:glutamate formiminotransferase